MDSVMVISEVITAMVGLVTATETAQGEQPGVGESFGATKGGFSGVDCSGPTTLRAIFRKGWDLWYCRSNPRRWHPPISWPGFGCNVVRQVVVTIGPVLGLWPQRPGSRTANHPGLMRGGDAD
ncbi:hypothetical protein CAPTEDRAFT_185033, partial [Capitella teleta]